MSKLAFNKSVLEYYLRLFRQLDTSSRHYISDQLKKDEPFRVKEPRNDLFGSWKGEESSDEITERIYSGRNFSRTLESL